MKPWQKALGDIRLLGPDIPSFAADTKLVYDYILKLEKENKKLQDKLATMGYNHVS